MSGSVVIFYSPIIKGHLIEFNYRQLNKTLTISQRPMFVLFNRLLEVIGSKLLLKDWRHKVSYLMLTQG